MTVLPGKTRAEHGAVIFQRFTDFTNEITATDLLISYLTVMTRMHIKSKPWICGLKHLVQQKNKKLFLITTIMTAIKRQNHKIILVFAMWTSIVINGCSEPSGIYIDIKKQAIISCNGTGLKEIRIENDSSEITLQSTKSIVYFNKINLVSRTSIYGDDVKDFELKLKPHCSYKVMERMGFDRGNFTITFRTDSLGKIVIASDTSWN